MDKLAVNIRKLLQLDRQINYLNVKESETCNLRFKNMRHLYLVELIVVVDQSEPYLFLF